jgi:uncharacterized protein (UPF0147 family)
VLIDINSKNKQVIMDSDTPEHIKRAAENAIQNLLPEKSSNRYWK